MPYDIDPEQPWAIETYSELEGRLFKRIPWTGAMPSCKIDYIEARVGGCDQPGEYDSPTIYGPWGDFCPEHVVKVAPPLSKLGYHRIRPKEYPIHDDPSTAPDPQ